MATVVSMPKLGLTMKHGTLVKWLVEEGASVKAGAEIADIMTEKIASRVAAPAAGILLKIVVAKGVKVPVGATLAVVGEAGEDIGALLAGDGGAAAEPALERAAAAPAAARGAKADAGAAGPRVSASPRARSLAAEKGVDLAGVAGTGPGGRITQQDVLDAAERGVDAQVIRPVLREIEYAGMRRMIGEHMATSWTIAPKVTHHVRVDASALLRFREGLNRGRPERAKISVTAVLTKAVASALARHPALNATLEGDTIKVWQDINVGVAMALPDGLIVPVVRNADAKGFTQIAAEIADFAKRAKRSGLVPEEVSGGTFTITNVGQFGSVDWFTPIINQPESAILGVGRIVDDVLAIDGAPAVRPAIGLSLSFDHRVVDGAPAAEFLRTLIDLIDDPMSLVP
jgi:pyruvate dehydrogenase E2 component (dihydrolipoamide acetyltransferase)